MLNQINRPRRGQFIVDKITREAWLTYAVHAIDKHLFNGDLSTKERGFQIATAKTGTKGFDFILPYQGEDVSLDDFFPITITIDYKIKNVNEMLVKLAYVMLKAFNDDPKGKRLKTLCKTYGFEAPYSNANPSGYAEEMITAAQLETEKELGKFPGKAIVIKPKEQKEKKPNKTIFFCPSCGWEVYASKKMMKDRHGYPTCICGTKMGTANEENENTENQNI